MSEVEDRQQQLAISVIRDATTADREALRVWAGALLDLRNEDLSVTAKAREAVRITSRAKVVWPLLKSISKQLRKHGWDNRSTSQRLGIGAAGTALALFGPAQAGIAALGGAVAVPLWVVFGAGAMFARHLYEEITRQQSGGSGASYKVIDADKEAD
ncbi:hypothetical protein ACQ3G6_08725 [Allorhizobium undicola]|uniref:hypothetical protein n=1 Tax=Allorhizobium undicola TaxID=78527 RepID=UPI003D34628C